MAREINLVPDIKNEMIKTLKLRNYIFFACIVIAAASAGVTFIFGVIAGGQELARNNRQASLVLFHDKLNSYSDLKDTITIRNQVADIGTLSSSKQVLSRSFNALTVMLPQGADTIQISRLDISLVPSTAESSESSDEEEIIIDPTFRLEAQANAGREPFIDYNVLDSFKKTMEYLRFDYGTYVDKAGNAIPAYCMIEQGQDGSTFKEVRDKKDYYYAYWTINASGCNPSDDLKSDDYQIEDYDGKDVVKVWRTPQFDTWYKGEDFNSEDEPYMALDGQIYNVAHFNSDCITYTGDNSENDAAPKWNDDNVCNLISTENGISIDESSNGRNDDNELVLRFTATIRFNPEFFLFRNHHMMAKAPSGRYNVTDSYVQVQEMFGKRAKDCSKNDADCVNNNKNKTGDN